MTRTPAASFPADKPLPPFPSGTVSGDNPALQLAAAERVVVANLKVADIPVLTVLLSRTAVIINDILDQSDVFIAAWMPGTEGQGVADVLFGDCKPVG